MSEKDLTVKELSVTIQRGKHNKEKITVSGNPDTENQTLSNIYYKKEVPKELTNPPIPPLPALPHAAKAAEEVSNEQ